MKREYGNSESFHLAAASCSKNIGLHYKQYLIILIWTPGNLLEVLMQTLFKLWEVSFRYADSQTWEYQ